MNNKRQIIENFIYLLDNKIIPILQKYNIIINTQLYTIFKSYLYTNPNSLPTVVKLSLQYLKGGSGYNDDSDLKKNISYIERIFSGDNNIEFLIWDMIIKNAIVILIPSISNEYIKKKYMEEIINAFDIKFNNVIISGLVSNNILNDDIKKIYNNIIQKAKNNPEYIYEIINYVVERFDSNNNIDNNNFKTDSNKRKYNTHQDIDYFIQLENNINQNLKIDKEVSEIIVDFSKPIIEEMLVEIIKQEFSVDEIPTTKNNSNNNEIINLLKRINSLKENRNIKPVEPPIKKLKKKK